MLLLVRRRDARRTGLDPDLQEVRDTLRLVVVLAVQHATARRHPLHVARPDRRAVAHRVLVSERALEHVADDLHVAVAVRAEAAPGLHAILVDDAQRAEAHVPRIAGSGKRESGP